MPGRISLTIYHDLIDDCAQDALLQLYRSLRMIPYGPAGKGVSRQTVAVFLRSRRTARPNRLSPPPGTSPRPEMGPVCDSGHPIVVLVRAIGILVSE
jgi:hypothetical protein